ncbi:MAG: hypothetical protein U1E76_19340 [Planctomycetota bacterium]
MLEKRIALNASANGGAGEYPGLFTFSATPAPGVALADLEKALDEEIERLGFDPATEDELARTSTIPRTLHSCAGCAPTTASPAQSCAPRPRRRLAPAQGT